ncbi:MAG TPA: Rne/Rng family ribonuclease [Propionibacteriaceae bacterium]|nr:Rne/Rng family ribonuclease [Propionibacteriaceae bacterium]
MLDPHEPDISTPETSEQPPAQPAPRRRRAASRPAGPPSSAPDAPSIHRTSGLPDPGSENATEAEAAPVNEKTAKQSAVKRTTKKVREEAPPSEGEVVKTPRKRTAKKAVAMAAEAPSDEAPADEALSDQARSDQTLSDQARSDEVGVPASQEPPEAAPGLEGALPVDTDVVADAVLEEMIEAPATEEPAAQTSAPEESAPEAEGVPEAAGDTATEADDAEETGEGRRRRRRRGGRRRRRTTGDEAESPQSEQADEDEATEVSDAAEVTGEGTRRRRRRRRRRGEEAVSAPDDPTETVVRVREPRRQDADSEVSGIDGSTRMEAKRQRRREGREAGRRRAPVLSEAEFLARRESVARKMIIRQRDDLVQIAVLEDDILVEHYVDRASHASLIGSVYLGRVQNVLPSMEAAFVDIGRGRNGVIYAGEVDWDYFGAEGQNRKVEKVLKSGQTILVQVSKDPVGAKGARLTNHVSIPGRYIVYAPGGHLSGISRKLPEGERRRLKEVLSDLVGESASVIVRTAAEGASEEELVRDVNRLKAQWEDIERKVATGNAPQQLYAEPDLTVRIVRDLFTEDFSELIISGNGGMTDAYDSVEAYVTHVAPHLKDRLRRWEGDHDLFAEYRLDEQIAKGLERKVFLPSGGSLIIDRTEAMTVIDVNTGKFTGTGGNLEATVTSNNLEAAEEIVRQLRLRDIGGIIVIDFIDMVLPNNRELLLRRLVECLGRDRTRHQVAEITSLGLVQMTRKRIGTGLLESFSTECPVCHGRGYELHDMPVESHRHTDGGARDSRPRDRRGNAQAGSGKATEKAISAGPAESDNEAAPEERPARSRRGGRSRRSAAGQDQEAAEPQSEPVVVS